VVDGYHAMISDRPYRKAMAKPEALAEIARNTGRQFDPLVVAAFVEVVG
jgi:HD-GYP domain-containing protein (c-di-GMP phosphodiesterase class II)